MENKRRKRIMIASLIVTIASIGATKMILKDDNVRAVEMVALIAVGISCGVFLTNAASLLKLKNVG